MQETDLLLVNMRGELLAGEGRPSSEVRMHLAVYEKRPDVEAIVHAHPPLLTAFTLAGVPFMADALPEVWLTIGPVPTAPYATPSTDEVPKSIAPFIEKHHAILLERHGSLTMGKDLKQAFLRLEKLEHAARDAALRVHFEPVSSRPAVPVGAEKTGGTEVLRGRSRRRFLMLAANAPRREISNRRGNAYVFAQDHSENCRYLRVFLVPAVRSGGYLGLGACLVAFGVTGRGFVPVHEIRLSRP